MKFVKVVVIITVHSETPANLKPKNLFQYNGNLFLQFFFYLAVCAVAVFFWCTACTTATLKMCTVNTTAFQIPFNVAQFCAVLRHGKHFVLRPLLIRPKLRNKKAFKLIVRTEFWVQIK